MKYYISQKCKQFCFLFILVDAQNPISKISSKEQYTFFKNKCPKQTVNTIDLATLITYCVH